MYGPKHFIEERADVVDELVDRAAFGHLVVAGSEGLASTPFPFVLDRLDDVATGIGHVRGHLARPNPMWRAAPCPALVIVPISDAYVSPSWYASKREHGRVVPTWNYEVVHVHGQLVAHDDPAWVGGLVRELTERHEGHRLQPWSVDDPPPGFVDAQLRAIVGIELVVSSLEAKRKLSQNRDAADRDGVVAGLDAEGSAGAAAVAAAMRSAAG